MNKGFSTPSLPIYSAGGMQSVLELTLALKVAPDTAVVKKKHLKLTQTDFKHTSETNFMTLQSQTTSNYLPLFEKQRDTYTLVAFYPALKT